MRAHRAAPVSCHHAAHGWLNRPGGSPIRAMSARGADAPARRRNRLTPRRRRNNRPHSGESHANSEACLMMYRGNAANIFNKQHLYAP